MSDLTERSTHYEFGENWSKFANSLTETQISIAQEQLLAFLGRENLRGFSFLDIGSGSGIHSLAAFRAGAKRVHSFDIDENSVSTTQRLRTAAGNPANWKIDQGSALDASYLSRLGLFDIVYSWGVLHHTGAMWKAIELSMQRVADGGAFFIALYSSNVASPSTGYWLDIKQRYNEASPIKRKLMELAYIWRFGLDQNPLRLPLLLKQVYDYKKMRGMSYMTGIRDWLGGWPMEYADDQETISFFAERGFKLEKIATGQACTEFLFRRD